MRKKRESRYLDETFRLAFLCFLFILPGTHPLLVREKTTDGSNHSESVLSRAVNDSPVQKSAATPDSNAGEFNAPFSQSTVDISQLTRPKLYQSTKALEKTGFKASKTEQKSIRYQQGRPREDKAEHSQVRIPSQGFKSVVQSARRILTSISSSVMDGPAVIREIELNDGKADMAHSSKNASHPFAGVLLAVGAAFLVGISFIFQKKGLMMTESKLRKGAVREKHGTLGEFRYLLQWTWWCGMLSMAVGEVMNFVAYSIAPAILITPLGALRVIVSAVLAAFFLDERLNTHGKIGVLLSLVGSVMIIIHAPRHEKVTSFEQVLIHFTDTGFLFYCVVLLGTTAFLIVYVAPKRGRTDIMVYISICNIVGALCVLCGKGLGISIKEIGRQGELVYLHPLFWVLALGNVAGVAVQIVYLNKSLAIFNTSMITPIKYVFTNIFLIFGSILLFQEFSYMSGEDIVGMGCGFITVVMGVILINLFNDRNAPGTPSTKR